MYITHKKYYGITPQFKIKAAKWQSWTEKETLSISVLHNSLYNSNHNEKQAEVLTFQNERRKYLGFWTSFAYNIYFPTILLFFLQNNIDPIHHVK